MIIKEKRIKVDEFYDTKTIDIKELVIKLIDIEKIKNMSFMFSGCPIENKENNDNNLYDDNNISFGSYDSLDGF